METTSVYSGSIGIMEKKMATAIGYCGYAGIMEKKMDTTIVNWGHMGILETKMEAAVLFRAKGPEERLRLRVQTLDSDP